MLICLVYDCLYPWTVGGAERWYRALAERLAAEGHEVTYLTLRQWEGEAPTIAGVRVLAVGPRMRLYAEDGSGRRRIGPPIRFGLGVLSHLLRRGRGYDVVHTASFPYFSLLAAGLLRPFGRYRLVVDWHEVWTPAYWRDYLGPIGGRVGWFVQRLCARLPQRACCFSRLHAERLQAEGHTGEVVVLRGEYAGPPPSTPAPATVPPQVLFAGRLIPEKQAASLVPTLALARQTTPTLRAVILGDGPERDVLHQAIVAHGLENEIEAPGFVEESRLRDELRRALCLVLPSRREGYGLIVVEAAALGVPSVVVAGPDNAAVELIEEGVNGVVASAAPADLAAAIQRVHAAGDALRASTAAWFARHADRLSLAGSLAAVAALYAGESMRETGHPADLLPAGEPEAVEVAFGGRVAS